MQSQPPGFDANSSLDALRDPAPIRKKGAWVGSAAVLAVIAVQIAVPFVALMLPPPQKFGFQMFSGLGGARVFVVDDEGAVRELDDVEQTVGKVRPDIDWLPTLPEAVCIAVPEAVEVRVEQSGRERSVVCD
ncbi:hypothetical protein [Agromyces ramosus]|uniref:hypothetical protein n=1 Tax=Agromyces ramosus TaxID=33879 RepID=UPI00102B289A|nr:hypothetical protein [Agromyces ramosus]